MLPIQLPLRHQVQVAEKPIIGNGEMLWGWNMDPLARAIEEQACRGESRCSDKHLEVILDERNRIKSKAQKRGE